jgi:HK97 family phage major capsid protein
MTTKELLEQRAKLLSDMRLLVANADAARREMTTEEDAKWNEMDADADRLKATIAKRQKLEAEERNLENPGTTITGHTPESVQRLTSEMRAKKENEAFTSWLRYGFEGLTPEQKMTMAQKRSFVDGSRLLNSGDVPAEVRAMGVGSGGAGGYTVPQGFSDELQKYLKQFGGVRQAARAFPTPTGQDIPWPSVDDTANKGELLAENSPANAQDVAFSSVTLHAYKFSSKIVLVSMELLQDSFFDINEILRDLLGERIGRITNDYFTTGTGTSQPQGVVTAATLGKQGASGQTTSIIYEDLVDMSHSIDPLYRLNARFMFNDSTLKAIKKIKDSNGRPLWQMYSESGFGSQVGQDTILGYPYTINQSMANMGTGGSPVVGNSSLLFGDFSRFIVRDVLDMTLLRLTERYAEYGQVGFLAFARCDSRTINTAAITYYQNANS